mgnify:CR=1 FL=1
MTVFTKISLRVKLTDFINTDIEQEVMNKINEAHNKLNTTVLLYLWFEEGEITNKDLKEFLMKWEDKLSYKTIIKQSSTIAAGEFIWFDIMPIGVNHSNRKRYGYTYRDTNKILDGLQEFYNIVRFTLSDKPIRKQKRNDYED